MYVAPAPTLSALLTEVPSDRFVDVLTLDPAVDGEYIHWDKLRHLEPPPSLTLREWWLGVKWARNSLLRPFPLTDENGATFRFGMPDEVLRLLHYVDQRCSGEIAMAEVVTADEQARQHYLVNSLMEEAIRSSQLEGATTSRKVAKDLLQTGRPPEDRSETMILNNYRALQFSRDTIGDSLTSAHVLEMQRILTEGTLDNPRAAGRLQTPADERVAVYDRVDGELIHRPPPAHMLERRLADMCSFANERDGDGPFIHPVIRSILLHLWLAYDHPFEDGNGRTARLLFYWSMGKHGYWLTEYLSISKILRQAPAKYTRAFVLTETDELDATYFILFQLKMIERAVVELHSNLRRKIADIRNVERAIKDSDQLNHRQLALLSHAIRNANQDYTFKSHARSHNVTVETARTDLLYLWSQGMLDRRKAGRQYVFSSPAGLADRLTK